MYVHIKALPEIMDFVLSEIEAIAVITATKV